MITECVLAWTYQAVLGRPADAPGAAYWPTQVNTAEELIGALAVSGEAAALKWQSKPEAWPIMADAVDIVCETPAPIETIVREAAREFAVNETLLLDIAVCESGSQVRGDYASININPINPASDARGPLQHRLRFWAARAAAVGSPGGDIMDPTLNARAGAWLLAEQGTAPWLASKRCWS